MQRTGQGVGRGHFDSDLSDADCPGIRWGRNCKDQDALGQKSSRWTPAVEQLWEDKLTGSRQAVESEGGCYRLYKARWQGQELSGQSVVKALARALEPIGVVDEEAARLSEMFDCEGLAPNRQEAMQGAGGGCYVPIGMRDIITDW